MGHVENIRNFPSNVRRLRERRRKRLTRGERILGWSLALGPGVLVILAVALLLSDDARALGIALLIVALAGMAVPIAPLLGVKVRRRDARAGRKQRE
jgi:hypothetical protein